MDKKEFKKITTKVYENYGFMKKGKYYYLDLKDVLICSGFSNRYGKTYLGFTFSIKALHTKDEYVENDMFEGYDCTLATIDFNLEERGGARIYIDYENVSPDYYEIKLENILKSTFDPFKINALKYIWKSTKEINLISNTCLIKIKVKEYLNQMFE